jgi:hypothetical protein
MLSCGIAGRTPRRTLQRRLGIAFSKTRDSRTPCAGPRGEYTPGMSFSRPLLIVFYIVALVAFASMLTIHVLTYWGVDAGQAVPSGWILYPLAIMVFAPAVQVGRDLAGAFRRPDYWKLALQYAPRIFQYAPYVVGAYVFANFFVCLVLLRFGSPGQFNGQPALLDHGSLREYLTDLQYRTMKAYETRLVSGMCMMFDLLAAAIFCSGKNAPPDFDRNLAVLIPPPGSSR